ncbi:hemolysin-III related-domain-containing protein [Irpex rosettiformis]|uniref:Hemolysin-III related-domain-containing protein n=1 Tax=Irpex rosettiformis TaxID=378272 RepID=A0ACB8TSY8_9APHY|nr:hemolysin-III related-domain-containing protein [Irpex rosettiformis]
MLERIRADVSSHLPELHTSEAVGEFVKSHMHIGDMDLKRPQDYVPTLSQHLQALQSHLSSFELPHGLQESVPGLKPHATINELIDLALAPKFVDPIAHRQDGQDSSKKAEEEIVQALRLTKNGAQLIDYEELPDAWKSNAFVTQGYRFIPLSHWYRIPLSLFRIHNETLNIHTHFMPLVFWALTLLPYSPFALPYVSQMDGIEMIFTGFTLLCMFNSSVWHTMSGCADPHAVEMSARIDYVGIGWLMSTTEGTIVYYGFREHQVMQMLWLGMLTLVFLASTVFPFMDWFNDVKHKGWRILFFVCIGFTSVAPMAHLAYIYGLGNMLTYMTPVYQSYSCYVIGLLFYAFHFPEAFFTRPGEKHWLDWFGGGSHGIWHMFVVLAIYMQQRAIPMLKLGIERVANPV